MDNVSDCIIIGGGPAGLTAAIYLARFHLSVRLFDDGRSRAALIPRTRNHAGFPDGIHGEDLLDRMRRQATEFGVAIERSEVTALALQDEVFTATLGASQAGARTVLLATGVINRRPKMPDDLHDRALAAGLLRYCPICDGYEATDQRIGVIGTSDHGTQEALFLRGFSADITLIAPDLEETLDEACLRELDEAGIVRVGGPCGGFRIENDRLSLETAAGRQSFDTIYPALGSDIRSDLATRLGARATTDGCVETDDHQRTAIPGLFAAGDVVRGLDQISHAMGQAGVAATAIRSLLDERRRLRR